MTIKPQRGRPPKSNNKITWTGRLAPDVAKYLRTRHTQVAAIEDAIRSTPGFQAWLERQTKKDLPARPTEG